MHAAQRAGGDALGTAPGGRWADLDASRADFAHIRGTLAGGGTVVGGELSAFKERLAALAEACEEV